MPRVIRRVCVLLPAFNEAANIETVVAAVRAVSLPDFVVTVLVVDDGSADDTAERARRAGAEVVVHPQNRGVGAAFRTGVEWARAHGVELLLHMDSDGQIDAAEIPLLLAPVAAGEADIAIGTRFAVGSPRALEGWKAGGLQIVARTVGVLTGQPLSDLSCGFRCMNRRVLDEVSPSFDFDYIQEVLIQAIASGARLVEVPVNVRYDLPGRRPGMSARVLRYGSRFLGLTAWALGGFYRRRWFGRRSAPTA
jgi:glycosyltransferase involved in cell wall biosynthesis